MAQAITFTDAKLAELEAPLTGQVEFRDAKVPGLRIRVGKTGAKTFILRKRIGGKLRTVSLGRHSARFRLADARRKARTLLSDIEAGVDPAIAIVPLRQAGPFLNTIENLWPSYRHAKRHLRSINEIDRIFRKYVLPRLGCRMADTVTRSEITRAIDEIALNSPVMARAVHAQLRSFYSWAMPRLDRLPANPCRDAGRPPAPKARDRVLSHAELVSLWRIAKGQPYPWGPGIQLLLLTGQRRSEIFEADKSEFDLEAALWTIPRERAKNDTEHLVPLSPAAITLLKSLIDRSEATKLFPARGNLAHGPGGLSKAVNRIRRELEAAAGTPVPHWSLHDLRRTVATEMQRLKVPMEVVEALLNHISGSRAGIVRIYQRYRYLDEKRDALLAWADELVRICEGEERGATEDLKCIKPTN
ncbi:site-specific integrase [Sphingomonas sp. LaA6.9]|uniref:tyrosine-type recombinase/integrase n=1 Tax=Sphingomonas sp. LaA6.9 TaxID=2919914 RepID=UPI001F4FD20D|nr:site-specific integrase [Sphingomonas sp. LaA6.9]MCJ8158859.1 tyrosine-type recombinase/integrase [Sphingomonas sp. LaA6.9]